MTTTAAGGGPKSSAPTSSSSSSSNNNNSKRDHFSLSLASGSPTNPSLRSNPDRQMDPTNSSAYYSVPISTSTNSSNTATTTNSKPYPPQTAQGSNNIGAFNPLKPAPQFASSGQMSSPISPGGFGSVGGARIRAPKARRLSFSYSTAKRLLGQLQTSLLRLFKVRQMDWELATWQFMWICVAPRRVYRNIYYHKQTKNQWARDDPAFVLIICAGLLVNALAYSIVLGRGISGFIPLAFWMIGVEFMLTGIVIATVGWFLSNKFLVSNHLVQSIEQSVEWLYCFDVHCNSFVPVLFLTYTLQLFFSPLLWEPMFVARVLGNSLYLLALVFYNYISFLGYSALISVYSRYIYTAISHVE